MGEPGWPGRRSAAATAGTARSRWLGPTLVTAAVGAAAAAAAAAPFLPAAADLYVHLLWSWETMRCLASGSLPLWLPDLNAGFGSPGIRLYSPLGPVVVGALGLLLGSAGAALRALPVLVWGAFLFVARRRRRGGAGEWLLLLAAPLVVHSLLVRAAWSEFLAVPLVWWLLDVTFEGDLAPGRDGGVLAALWLLHAPTTMMTVVLIALAGLVLCSARTLARGALALTVAAGLTMWHWLPLAGEMRLTDRTALTGGIFEATRNALGSPSAHALGENVWLGWCAVALLAAVLIGRWWRAAPARTACLVAAVALASPLAAALYRPPSPLALLQFPWRWLLPAAVLAALPAQRGIGRASGRLAVALAIAPLAVAPFPRFARDPGLAAAMTWRQAGPRVFAAISGNPLLVDAAQNRPASFRLLGANVVRFGARDALLEGGAGSCRVLRWAPLERRVAVELDRPASVALRLLAYPNWQASVDGAPVPARDAGGVVAVEAPAGRHEVAVRWSGNPLSAVGLAVGAATALGLLLLRRRRPRRGGEAMPDGR